MRGDLSRAARNAVELARLTREHDLPMWRAFGVFLEGVAKTKGGELIGGSPTCVAAPKAAGRCRRCSVVVYRPRPRGLAGGKREA
jgi:hypothetical protein